MPDAPWTTWAPGTRVVVRRRLAPDEATAAGTPLTDVIGVVVRTTPTELVLREDAGGSAAPPHRGHGVHDDVPPLVVVPLDAIVAGKPVPPRPPRRPASPR
ncbi:hypothetical protein JOE63_001722 [Cellulosimicrobium cellulans]|uniref:putative acetyltransferase n=1 Tax=Cellulosimicrobium cellulans TaxID=1710 RepID=UPI00195D32D6|nr:hypothetical protein [Cellulosimicrobium cellulans]MBM7819245.1 hypothetical protein [Cellulosimicrobium cellulans]